MGYVLGNKSRRRLYGVHPDLVLVVNKAIEITTQDFTVLEGLRTAERQQQLYNTGKSKTMNSRHLTGHAVDLAPWPITWDWDYFYPIADAMKSAADELDIPIEWGGDWQSFPDGPHFQLPWKEYPA
jgi:peptidoglycan L-alanyl-D-glutamate endopeptidase CwlK